MGDFWSNGRVIPVHLPSNQSSVSRPPGSTTGMRNPVAQNPLDVGPECFKNAFARDELVNSSSYPTWMKSRGELFRRVLNLSNSVPPMR
jgi:hypothetical protein